MIVYLHGFSSAAASRKANYLKQQLQGYEFYVPDYLSHRPREAIRFLTNYLTRLLEKSPHQKLMLIGSSLGGYYAQYLGATINSVGRVVLINPALQAQQLLAPYLGEHTNMVTGETFEFTSNDLEELGLFEVADMEKLSKTLVLLDQGDEVIDYHFAAHRYQEIGHVVVYPGGSHWFDHLDEALPQIIAFYQQLES